MDDGVNFIFGKDFLDRLGITDIRLIVRYFCARYLLYPFDRDGAGVGIIVRYDHAVSRFYQLYTGMRADITRAAC